MLYSYTEKDAKHLQNKATPNYSYNVPVKIIYKSAATAHLI